MLVAMNSLFYNGLRNWICVIDVCLLHGKVFQLLRSPCCEHAFIMRVKARKRFDLVVEVSVQRRFY